jgi:hypothetical protein
VSRDITHSGADVIRPGRAEVPVAKAIRPAPSASPLRGSDRQRCWLTPDKVINTWPLDRFQECLRKKRYAIPLR